MNKVRVSVRHIALDGASFTAFDIQRRTGLNIESIRTEIQRLRKDGFIEAAVSKTLDQPGKERGRGAPPAMYSLTTDPKRVRELRESVASFYLSTSIPRASHPTSEHYFNARGAISDAIATVDGTRRGELLAKADFEMEAAWLAEGDDGATDELKAHLLSETAKIALSRGEYSKARKQFAQCRDVFRKHTDRVNASIADDYLLACDLRIARNENLPFAIFSEVRRRTTNSLALAVLDTIGLADEVRLDDDYMGNDMSGNEFRQLIGELEVCGAALA